MDIFITKVEIIGLHDRYDIHQEFGPGVNIIFGSNGDFKTTLLRTIANLSNNDFERFFYLDFHQVSIHLNDGVTTSIGWENKSRQKLIVRQDGERSKIAELSKAIDGQTNFILRGEVPLPSCAYFPTARTVLEALFSSGKATLDLKLREDSTTEREKRAMNTTSLLREMFGQFMPNITFNSVPEIMHETKEKLGKAAIEIIQVDQRILANSFSEAISFSVSDGIEFQAVEENIGSMIEKIRGFDTQLRTYPIYRFLQLPKAVVKHIEGMEGKRKKGNDYTLENAAIALLSICQKSLGELVSEVESSFSEFRNYLKSINSFLSRKKIEIKSKSEKKHEEVESKSEEDFYPSLVLKFEDEQAIESNNYSDEDNLGEENIEPKSHIELSEGKNIEGAQNLSSGEKQIISLLYAAHISEQQTILIDEPEISLHIDWQEKLLDEMEKQLGQKQIIVCTHSPMIGGHYSDDVVKPVNISRTQKTRKYMADLVLHIDDDNIDRDEEIEVDVYDGLTEEYIEPIEGIIEEEAIKEIPPYMPPEDKSL